MTATTGADLFVQALRDRGVEFVTTVSGNGTEPLYEACRQARVRLVDFRNEQAAAFAADAAARLTRRLHVCAVSSAVGHANALIGVVNAWFDGSPVLLFSGASPHVRTDIGTFQDMDPSGSRRPSPSTPAESIAPSASRSTSARRARRRPRADPARCT